MAHWTSALVVVVEAAAVVVESATTRASKAERTIRMSLILKMLLGIG